MSPITLPHAPRRRRSLQVFFGVVLGFVLVGALMVYLITALVSSIRELGSDRTESPEVYDGMMQPLAVEEEEVPVEELPMISEEEEEAVALSKLYAGAKDLDAEAMVQFWREGFALEGEEREHWAQQCLGLLMVWGDEAYLDHLDTVRPAVRRAVLHGLFTIAHADAETFPNIFGAWSDIMSETNEC